MKKSEVLKEASVAIQRTEALEREVESWKKGAIQRQIKLDSISAEHNNQLQEVVAAKDQVVEELKASKAARATLLEKNKKLRQEIEGKSLDNIAFESWRHYRVLIPCFCCSCLM